MTYTILELQRFTCDGCEKQEQREVSEQANPIEYEQDLIEELKKQGWTYDKENDTHKCPECTKKVK